MNNFFKTFFIITLSTLSFNVNAQLIGGVFEPIVKDPILIKDPIIITDPIWIPIKPIEPIIPIIPIIPITTYEKRPLAADAIAFADFNGNDTVDYVRTDSTDTEVILEIKYDSVRIEDDIYNSDTSSIPVYTSDTSAVNLKSVKSTSFSLLPSSSTANLLATKIDLTSTIYNPIYLGDYYTINKFNLIDGSYIFRDFIDNEDDNRVYIPNGAISIGDFNNDNLADFLVSGEVYIKNKETNEYGVFNKAMVWYNLDTAFMIMWSLTEPIEDGEVWDKNIVEDYNHDGLQDICVGGYIYLNDGLSFNNSLRHINEVAHVYDYQGKKVYLDYDSDGDMDYHYNDTLYINQSNTANDVPLPPSNLTHYINSDTVIFCWSPGSDTETNASKLTYNIWVGITGNGTQIVSPLADLTSGKRKLFRVGNAGTDTCYKLILKDAITAKLYWSVQTIDGNYQGSIFPEKQEVQYSVITPYLKNHEVSGNPGRMLNGATSLFDADNDNDLDLLTSGNFFTLENGYLEGFGGLLRLYSNENNYDLLDVKKDLHYDSTLLKYLGYTSSVDEIFDFNKDGLIDFIISGNQEVMQSSLTPVSKPILSVYQNLGSQNFEEIVLDSILANDIVTGDVDNDGDDDILVCGLSDSSPVTYLYENNEGSFIRHIKFDHIAYGNVVLADYDNDFDLDILLNGYDGTEKKVCLYENRDSLNFVKIAENDFGLTNGDAVACDLNNDKFIDFVITGDFQFTKRTYILRNSAKEKLVPLAYNHTGLPGIGGNVFDVSYAALAYTIEGKSSIDFGDFDNDGLIDLVMAGKGDKRTTFLYKNMGEFKFESVDFFFDRVEATGIDIGDIDNDGDIDFYIQGYNGTVENCCLNREMYINNRNLVSSIDTVNNTGFEYLGLDILLKWEDIYNGDNYNAAVTYNIMVGTQPGLGDVVAPLSDPVTGYRRVTKGGNASNGSSWKLIGLDPGKYYWQVQVINAAYKGGVWSPVDSFVVSTLSPKIYAGNVCFGDTTFFVDSTISSTPVTEWLWDFGDGNISELQHPAHVYSAPGKYYVTLTAYNETDAMSVTDSVLVYNLPNANFTVEPVCKGEISLMKNISDVSKVQVTEWKWTFRNGFNIYGDGDVEIEYSASDYAQLRIETVKGCVDTHIEWVEVADYPDDHLSQFSTKLCKGETDSYQVLEYDAGYKYIWYKNSKPFKNNLEEIIVGDNATYHFEAINPTANCRSVSNSVSMEVIDRPEIPRISVNGFSNDTIEICPERSLKFKILNYNKVYKYDLFKDNSDIDDIEGDQFSEYIGSKDLFGGSFRIEASVDDQCAVSSDPVLVKVLESPDVTPQIIVNDGPDIFIMSCNVETDYYQWYKNGKVIPEATKNFYITGSEIADYTVEVREENIPCPARSKTLLIPNLVTDINSFESQNQFSVYPNPAREMVNIKVNNEFTGKIKVCLQDLSGKALIQKEVEKYDQEFNYTLETNYLAKGIYVIKVNMANDNLMNMLMIK